MHGFIVEQLIGSISVNAGAAPDSEITKQTFFEKDYPEQKATLIIFLIFPLGDITILPQIYLRASDDISYNNLVHHESIPNPAGDAHVFYQIKLPEKYKNYWLQIEWHQDLADYDAYGHTVALIKERKKVK